MNARNEHEGGREGMKKEGRKEGVCGEGDRTCGRAARQPLRAEGKAHHPAASQSTSRGGTLLSH